MERVGDRLKKLRKKYKFTQKQLADYLNFDQSHIAKLENNKRRLQVDILEDLCSLYNCSENYILYGENDYDRQELNYRFNLHSLDLNTVAGMNPLIRNLSFLTSVLDNKCFNNVYNSKLTSDVSSKVSNCKRIWNINENDYVDIINICLNKFDNITLVFFATKDNMSGSSLSVNDEWMIFINSNHTLGRQRFTIAHELYHLIYGENEFVNCSINSKTKEEEDADEFASYLLMSDRALLNYRLENQIDEWKLDDIIDCEQYFQISRTALLKRFEAFDENIISNNKFTEQIKYNAIKRGFSDKLYVPYSQKNNLVMGSYIRLVQKAYEEGKITKGKNDELLRDAYYYDLLDNKDMDDLFA